MLRLFVLVIVIFMLYGCASSPWLSHQSVPEKTANPELYLTYPSNTLHKHVEQLARQLLTTSQTFDNLGVIAVGTVLPAYTASGESLPQDEAVSLQVQESLITFATQAGLRVVEYKTRPTIKITQAADKMLSRHVEELTQSIAADYFLTGTYSKQENSTLVNIRLVKIPENIVLAAATDYVPNDVMWRDSKVIMKYDHIYRRAY